MNEQRARSLANLRPFRPGQSGNPRGRAPDPLLRALRQKMTAQQAKTLVGVLLERAEAGDMKALEMIWDRLEGKAIAREERGGPGDFAGGFEIRLLRAGGDDDDDAAAP